MKIGVTGHQRRRSIDWNWVHEAIAVELSKVPTPVEGLSALADGADQIFAELVFQAGGALYAIIPMPDYEQYFEGEAGERYRLLLAAAAQVEILGGGVDEEEAFLEAGRQIVDRADVLFAIWDGKPAQGKGGTADVVAYAMANKKNVIHIDPTSKTVSTYAQKLC